MHTKLAYKVSVQKIKTPVNNIQYIYLIASMIRVLFVTGALITFYMERKIERVRIERCEKSGY